MSAPLPYFPFLKNLKFKPDVAANDPVIKDMLQQVFPVPCLPEIFDMEEYQALKTSSQLADLQISIESYKLHLDHRIEDRFSAVRYRYRMGSSIGRVYPYCCVNGDPVKSVFHYMDGVYRQNVCAAFGGIDFDMVKAHPSLILAMLKGCDLPNMHYSDRSHISKWIEAIEYYVSDPEYCIERCIEAISGSSGEGNPINAKVVKMLFNRLSYGGSSKSYLDDVLKGGSDYEWRFDENTHSMVKVIVQRETPYTILPNADWPQFVKDYEKAMEGLAIMLYNVNKSIVPDVVDVKKHKESLLKKYPDTTESKVLKKLKDTFLSEVLQTMELYVVAHTFYGNKFQHDSSNSLFNPYAWDGVCVFPTSPMSVEEIQSFLEEINDYVNLCHVSFINKPFNKADGHLVERIRELICDEEGELLGFPDHAMFVANATPLTSNGKRGRGRPPNPPGSNKRQKGGSESAKSNNEDVVIPIGPNDDIDAPFPSTETSIDPFRTVPKSLKVCMDHFCSRVFKVKNEYYRKFHIVDLSHDKWKNFLTHVYRFEDAPFSRKQLKDAYENCYFTTPEGIVEDPKYCFIDKFFKSTSVVNYDTTENRPPRAPPSQQNASMKVLNTWKDYRFTHSPLSKEELEGSPHVAFFNDYLNSLFGDQDGIKQFLKCSVGLALDRPEVRQTRMLIMHGVNGNGKSSLGRLLMNVFGTYVCSQTSNPKRDVFGQFNSSLLFSNVIFMDEIDTETFGKLDANTGAEMDGVSKSTMSNNMIEINLKGKTAFTIESFHYFGPSCTNHKDACPTGRRYLVCLTKDTLVGNTTYWRDFNKRIHEEEFAHHVFWHLVHHSRDHPTWHWDDEVQNDYKVTRGLGVNHSCVQFMFHVMHLLNENMVFQGPWRSAATRGWEKYCGELKLDLVDSNGLAVVDSSGAKKKIEIDVFYPKEKLKRGQTADKNTIGLIGFNVQGIKQLINHFARTTGTNMYCYVNLNKLDEYFQNNAIKAATKKSVYLDDEADIVTGKKPKCEILVLDLTVIEALYDKNSVFDSSDREEGSSDSEGSESLVG